MKRNSTLTLAVLLASAPVVWGWTINCTRVRPIPPAASGPCPDTCKTGICPTLFPPEHAHRLIEDLHANPNFAARVCDVEKLSNPLHASPCRDPEVFEAIVGALQCDKAWEVRRAAAVGIRHQRLVCRNALLALYLASQTDPHFTVRFKAAESLDLLTLPYAPACFKEMRAEGDRLIAELRKRGYQPGSDNCRVLLDGACSSCGVAPYFTAPGVPAAPALEVPSTRPPVVPEPIPLPKSSGR